MSAQRHWLAWSPDDGQTEADARPVAASSPEAAAEWWAEADDRESADYSIVRGNDALVMVTSDDGGPPLAFIVEGRAVPCYTAKRRP
jgi:hypothetical protein